MATISKLNVKHTYPSWFTQLHAQSKAAADARNDAAKLREISKATRIETDSKTKFDQYDSANRLADTIQTTKQWRDLFHTLQTRVRERMAMLRDAKLLTEDYLVKLADAQQVNIEALTFLDHRRHGEYIVDPVEDELRSEQSLLKELYTTLQNQILEAFEAQIRLKELSTKIEQNIQDKREAFRVDIDQYNLNEKSAGVGLKPFPTRVAESRVDLQTWDDRNRTLAENATQELDKVTQLIHRLHLGLHQAANRMGAKADRVMDALRMRLHDTERAIRELEYQREMLQRESETLLREMHNLEKARRAKYASLKVAHTRLEGRQAKPDTDDVHDAAHDGLIVELGGIGDSVDALDAQLEKARDMLGRVENQVARLCQEARMKLETQQIYQELVNIRKRLETPPQTRIPPCPMIPTGIVREPKRF